MPESDVNYNSAVEILNKIGYKFFLDQGSLLGCVRENRLLPWDHDIDFAVWKDQVNVNIIKNSFLAEGYSLENISMDMNCLHFIAASGKKIDITLYDTGEGLATTRWVAHNKGFACRLLRNIIESLDKDAEVNSFSKRGKVTEIIFRGFKILLVPVPAILKKKILGKVRKLQVKFPDTEIVKFSVPIELLSSFQQINFLGREILIPSRAEDYLAHLYGADWRVPKQKFDWRNECGGLTPESE